MASQPLPWPTSSARIPTLSSNRVVATRRALYFYLCLVAERGEVCPRGKELGEAVGYAVRTVGKALADLAEEGLISIERRGAERRITIAATGQKTATPPAWFSPPFRPKRPVREIAAKAIELSGRPARDILGRSRFKEHVRVRQVIFSAAIREGWSIAHVSRVFGYDHSTVCHARDVLPRVVKVDAETRELIAALQRELQPLPEVRAA